MLQLRFVAESVLQLLPLLERREGALASTPSGPLDTAETAQKRHRGTEKCSHGKGSRDPLKLLYRIPLCVPGSQGSRPTSTKKCAQTELLVLAFMV